MDPNLPILVYDVLLGTAAILKAAAAVIAARAGARNRRRRPRQP